MSEQLKPLCSVLDGVLERLSVIEAKLGISPGELLSSAAPPLVDEEEVHPRLLAYDEHVEKALVPFTDSCTALGPEMEKIGASIADVWGAMSICFIEACSRAAFKL